VPDKSKMSDVSAVFASGRLQVSFSQSDGEYSPTGTTLPARLVRSRTFAPVAFSTTFAVQRARFNTFGFNPFIMDYYTFTASPPQIPDFDNRIYKNRNATGDMKFIGAATGFSGLDIISGGGNQTYGAYTITGIPTNQNYTVPAPANVDTKTDYTDYTSGTACDTSSYDTSASGTVAVQNFIFSFFATSRFEATSSTTVKVNDAAFGSEVCTYSAILIPLTDPVEWADLAAGAAL